LEPHSFSRAYINIINLEDVITFRESFDGYVFVDSQGDEYPAMVEFAPYQKVPKTAKTSKRKDPKMGTIESDSDYLKFKEAMENPEKASQVMQPEQQLEEIEARERIMAKAKTESQSTPLLDFIREKKAEKMRIREEKREARRKKEEERKRNREDERVRRQKEQKAATSSGSATVQQELSASKPRRDQKEYHTADKGDAVVTTRVFKSTAISKRRPEKRGRSGKEEPVLPDSLKRTREKKENIRYQKRSEISEKRQKERNEQIEKKKLDARQEKKLRKTAPKTEPSDDTFVDAEEESAFVAKPKRYSDRRREEKIKRESKMPPVADEKLSEQFSNMAVDTRGISYVPDEGNGKKTGKGGGNDIIKRKKEEPVLQEAGEEKELTEEEKRRKEEIRVRRDKERQERKERMKNKTRPEAQIYRPGQFSSQRKRDKDKVSCEKPLQQSKKNEEKEDAMALPCPSEPRRGGGRSGGRGGYLQSKGKGRRGGGVDTGADEAINTSAKVI